MKSISDIEYLVCMNWRIHPMVLAQVVKLQCKEIVISAVEPIGLV